RYDVYEHFADKLGCNSREAGKAAFMKALFGRSNDTMAAAFNAPALIRWMEHIKTRPLRLPFREQPSPKTFRREDGTVFRSYHPNLACLLQRTESAMLRKHVWDVLAHANIPLL